jgi:hypothetical protein
MEANMLKKVSLAAALSLIAIANTSASAQTQDGRCAPLGGLIAVTVVGGEPVRVLGTVTGALAGTTQATVRSQENRRDGTIRLAVTHDFVVEDRSSLTTEDEVIWTPIPDRAGVFAMQTRYRVVRGTGRFATARGEFQNQGEADTNRGLVTLTYFGEICGVRG